MGFYAHCLLENLVVVALKEKTPFIAKDFGLQNQHIGDSCGNHVHRLNSSLGLRHPKKYH
jgi:hypothetical protein